MKQFITTIIITIISLTAYCQQRDITRFLDIPVEGKKSEMIRKIKAKGFKTTKFTDEKVLTGKFNGEDVNVDVITNDKDEVYRVVVWNKSYRDEQLIRIQFNNLCYQFKNSSKYISNKDWSIPEDEDISYELNVHKKRYQAIFFQWPTEIGDSIIKSHTVARCVFNSKYDELSKDERDAEVEKIYFEELSELVSKKTVYFKIIGQASQYTIMIYYENAYNRANGEDL